MNKRLPILLVALIVVVFAGGALITDVWIRAIAKAVVFSAISGLAFRSQVSDNRMVWGLMIVGSLLGAFLTGGLELGWVSPLAAGFVVLVWAIGILLWVKRLRSSRTAANG